MSTNTPADGERREHGGDVWAGVRLIPLAGIDLHAITLDQAVDMIIDAVRRGTRGYIVTPNVHHVVLLQRHAGLRIAYDHASLRLPDGMPLLWASRLSGRPLKARIAGADLLPALCKAAALRGHTVFFLGGRAGVAQRAAARLAAACPGLCVAGTYTPPEGFAVDTRAMEEAVCAVNKARPDILFVGVGAPTQELWVHQMWDRLQVTVAVCCGAALDYAAGTQRRAPRWVQGVGLEWMWRLVHEPRRLWYRYLVQDVAFVGIILSEWWQARAASERRA